MARKDRHAIADADDEVRVRRGGEWVPLRDIIAAKGKAAAELDPPPPAA